MKKLILITALLSTWYFTRAQKLTCTECKLSTSVGDQDAFEILIPKCNADDISKSLEKWLKKHDGDVSDKKGEIRASRVVFKDFYQIPVTVFAKTEAAGTDVKLKISVDTGLGLQAIKLRPAIYQQFKDVVKGFCINEARNAAQQRLDDATKQLNSLNGDLNDLKKEKDKLQKEIDDCTAAIEKNKQTMQKNDSGQDKKTNDINQQNQKVKDLKSELDGIY